MSNEFRPGHPIIFWSLMVIFVFVAFSAAKAGFTVTTCNNDQHATKGWVVFPPKWECGATGIHITENN